MRAISACTRVHACLLEEAPIEPGTIDVAFSVFVLEHIEHPAPFFAAVHRALKPGGVFWSFTIDARNAYAKLSTVLQRVALKDRYLDLMFGRREERHRNYPTHYTANTPEAVRDLAAAFSSVEAISLHSVGIIDGVLPRPVRPLWHVIDRATIRKGWPGANLVVRLVK